MPLFYFSGVDRAKHVRLLAQEGGAAMINAASARAPDLLGALMQHPEVPAVLDSGWRKSISFEEYVELLRYLDTSYPGRFSWFSNYDVASQQASDAYYRELIMRLPHLRAKILWMFHLTWGTKAERRRQIERLYTLLSHGQSVGLGGLVPILRRSTSDALLFLQEIGVVLGNLYLPAHVFGVSSPHVLFWLRTQPWVISVDSSRWLAASRSGEVVRLDGTQRRVAQMNLPLTREEIAAVNIRVMRSWFDPLSASQVGLWEDPSDEDREAGGEVPHANMSTSPQYMLRWLLSYNSRYARFHMQGSSPSTGHLTFYTPLFSIEGREFGLLLWEGTIATSTSEWSVIWSVLPEDLPLSPNRLFCLDDHLKSGIYSLDDIWAPCLCRYPLSIAISVAKAMTPLSELM